MKTYNQFLETPFSEEVKPEAPEPQKEDPSIKSKEKRQMQIKKQVLLKKMQAVRAGAGADIVAGYEPEGEELSELSKRTLGNYVKDASSDAAMTSMTHGNKPLAKDAPKREKKILKRLSGIRKATDKLSKEEVVHEGDYHSGQGEKIQKRTKKWMEKKGQKGAPGLDAMKARTAEHKAKRGVKEATDKAFEYVKKQIAAKYGKDSYVSKDNPMKPPTAAQKKAAAAHRAKLAKQDHRDPTEKASDGRYSDRHSNRGSD